MTLKSICEINQGNSCIGRKSFLTAKNSTRKDRVFSYDKKTRIRTLY
ncbi:hypothetical protein [Aquimarina hainanensis]